MISAIPPRRGTSLILNKIDRINTHLKQKCENDQGLQFICPAPTVFTKKFFKDDLVHFKPLGEKLYAENLAKEIQGFHESQAQLLM